MRKSSNCFGTYSPLINRWTHISCTIFKFYWLPVCIFDSCF